MSGVYARLVAIYDEEDEPKAAVRAALQVLRNVDPKELDGGVELAHWRSAVDGFLRRANVADEAARNAAADDRRLRWATVCADLQALGCQVWQCAGGSDRWQIEAPSFTVELDLATGRLLDDDGRDYDPSWHFDRLVETIGYEISQRRRRELDEDRRRDLRKDHRWVNGRGWVPKTGKGPVIPGGGRI